jgi:WD40 repeat protein
MDKPLACGTSRLTNRRSRATFMRGHEGYVTQMSVSPDSRWLVTAGAGDPVPRVWDLRADTSGSKEVVLRTSGIAHWLDRKLHLSPDGHWLAAEGNPARIWNLNSEDPESTRIDLRLSGEEANPLQPDDPLKSIVPWVITSRWLVTTNRRNDSPRLWDFKAKDPAASQQPLLDSTGPICISPDDKWLAVASSTNIQLWDLTADSPSNSVRILPASASITSVSISPDSRWLAAGMTTLRVFGTSRPGTSKLLRGP